MSRNLILLFVLISLYFISSFVLNQTYGDSYLMFPSEDSWIPDSAGGWEKHGEPSEPMPENASINVPLILRYVPFLLPGFVLILFLFTPLSRYLESKPADKDIRDEDTADIENDET